MKTIAAAILTATLLIGSSAFAREFKGVKMPDTTTVDGQELKLKGMGLRSKFVFDVYVAGLYLADPSKDALSDQARQVKIVMLRELSKDQIADAIKEGFQKNAASDMPKLKDRLDKLMGVLESAKKGDTLTLTYVPGKGTLVSGRGKDLTTIEGADFANALFSVWLGKSPVDEDLKKGMLGKS